MLLAFQGSSDFTTAFKYSGEILIGTRKLQGFSFHKIKLLLEKMWMIAKNIPKASHQLSN